MKRIIILLFISSALCCGCAPKTYSYKVIFQDGTVEYFELDYKPKQTVKSIDYNGETFLGVEAVEPID